MASPPQDSEDAILLTGPSIFFYSVLFCVCVFVCVCLFTCLFIFCLFVCLFVFMTLRTLQLFPLRLRPAFGVVGCCASFEE